MVLAENSHNDDCGELEGAKPSTTSSPIPILPNSIVDGVHNQRLSIHRLPTEVLSMIFRSVTRVETCILDPHVTVSRTITLGAVCSYWRRITIDNGALWTYIPIRNTATSPLVTSLCLERSRDSLIDVSAYLPGMDRWNAEGTLSLHTHRIRSLYISSARIENIRLIMECILSSGVPKSLKYLSIKIPSPHRRGVGATSESILPPYLPKMRETLHELVKQLHTLRVKGVSLAPGSYSFDRIHDLFLDRGDPTDVIRVLAPGNKVQSIEIRKLLPGDNLDLPMNIPIAIESLKRLYLGGISDSAPLYDVLGSIPPGPYEIELGMIPRRISVRPECVFGGMDKLGPILHKFDNITTLILISDLIPPSLVFCENTRKLLQSLPKLHSLDLVRFRLTQPSLVAMTRRYDQESTYTDDATFPILRRLRLRSTRITDYDAFKDMIFSHKIDRIRISHCKLKWDGDTPTSSPSSSSPLYQWLSTVVPTVSIV